MVKIQIKGHEFDAIPIRDSFGRRAQQWKNKVILSLGKLGLTEDDLLIDIDPMASKKIPASASWYLEGHHLHFTYSLGANYAENLQIVAKVIDHEVEMLLAEKKTLEEFLSDFSEGEDVALQRKEARKALGVSEDVLDFGVIDSAFKELAKKYHPDMPEGSTEKFKEINRAHKILKRELL